MDRVPLRSGSTLSFTYHFAWWKKKFHTTSPLLLLTQLSFSSDLRHHVFGHVRNKSIIQENRFVTQKSILEYLFLVTCLYTFLWLKNSQIIQGSIQLETWKHPIQYFLFWWNVCPVARGDDAKLLSSTNFIRLQHW